MFIEAKVIAQKNYYIKTECSEFKNGMFTEKKNPEAGFTSNLFVQLYLKYKLYTIAKNNEKETKDLPKCLWIKKRGAADRDEPRKIGVNGVVKDAFEKIKCCKKVFYIALVPTEINKFKSQIDKIKGAKIDKGCEKRKREIEEIIPTLGHLYWEKVENYCKKKNLEKTIEVFRHNENQIYKKSP